MNRFICRKEHIKLIHYKHKFSDTFELIHTMYKYYEYIHSSWGWQWIDLLFIPIKSFHMEIDEASLLEGVLEKIVEEIIRSYSIRFKIHVAVNYFTHVNAQL